MIGRLLDLIWPRACEACGRPADRPGRHLCSDCVMRLPVIPTDGLCRRCGRDAAGLDGEYLCDDCRAYRPQFDRAVSALRFEGVARDLVNGFKFRAKLHLRDDLVDFLEAAVRARFRVEKIDCVVPMPSTLGHRWLRGFNQCEILAKAIARRLNRPCRALLRRVGNPARQGGLDEAARRTNVVGTFAVRRSRRPLPRVALVVDDIMTTGSTLSEAARTLKTGGVRTVWTATITRSVRY